MHYRRQNGRVFSARGANCHFLAPLKDPIRRDRVVDFVFKDSGKTLATQYTLVIAQYTRWSLITPGAQFPSHFLKSEKLKNHNANFVESLNNKQARQEEYNLL